MASYLLAIMESKIFRGKFMYILRITDLDFDRNVTMPTAIVGGATASAGVTTSPGSAKANASAKANGDLTLTSTRTITSTRSNPYASAGAGAAGAAAGGASVQGTKVTVGLKTALSVGLSV
ncbi:MAG: hypothetical protein HC860_18390 [Alkalinema sp. RU_4_3]|nr:hypothetical protein [Alkalinema sp. RU_4_3]